MLVNELQKQARESQSQARRILELDRRSLQQDERIEREAAENRRLSAQVAQLRGLFEQAIARNERRGLAATLSRKAALRVTWSADAAD
jgi:hypothetical protein